MARALLLLGVLLAIAPPAQALRFEPPQPLPQSLPDDGAYNGGEPSIAFDPHADGHVYVTAPQGVPARAGGKTGVAFWGSADGGQTWPIAQLTGAGTGGGDSDVDVLGDHTVLVADLELVSSALCISTDFGKTFPGCGDLAVTREEGAEEDRQWL